MQKKITGKKCFERKASFSKSETSSGTAWYTHCGKGAGIDKGGEGEGDAVPQLLLVAQPQLTLIVDLRPVGRN
jgi:hypothetical protein